MKEHITKGGAVVVAAEKTIKGMVVEGWALPGGKFTVDCYRARAAATHMARIIKANGGLRRGNTTL